MGFGTVAANILMFISILLLAGGALIVMNIHVQETNQQLRIESDRLQEQIGTNVVIQNVNYDNGTVTAYVINDGRTDLGIEDTDIFVEGSRISRNDRTITITSDTQITSSDVWSPSEVIEVTTDTSLNSGRRTFKIVTENGISDEEGFDV